LSLISGELLGTKDLFVTLLQPRFDLLAARAPGTPGAGWQGVRRFLQQTARTLAASGQDLVVVHVDADIRHLSEVGKHLGASVGEDLAPLLARNLEQAVVEAAPKAFKAYSLALCLATPAAPSPTPHAYRKDTATQ
jgi:class 3 adenylate cyclase